MKTSERKDVAVARSPSPQAATASSIQETHSNHQNQLPSRDSGGYQEGHIQEGSGGGTPRASGGPLFKLSPQRVRFKLTQLWG